ncbi:MAG: TFIIB-type zinc ribbon-containing protein, partial [Thermoplasmata archaeon]
MTDPAPDPPAGTKRGKATGRSQDLVTPARCTNCGSNHLTRDYDRGEVVCDECGLVLEEAMIDQGPEWRAFD